MTRAAELAGQNGEEALRRAVEMTTALVERHEPEICDIAGVLGRRKRIRRGAGSVKETLARVSQRPKETGHLSTAGRMLCDKIMGAFDELGLLAPLTGAGPTGGELA